MGKTEEEAGEDREGYDAPPSGPGCQNAVECDGKLHPDTSGVSNRGKALINIKANQMLKHDSLRPVAVYQYFLL